MTNNAALSSTRRADELTVSIAMTTFNGGRFLPEQLASLASQMHKPDELVVVDDCSVDETMDILRAFAQSAPFPVVIFQNSNNIGYKANFMRCVSRCSGRLIAFCDQDDIWAPAKLWKVVQTFRTANCMLVHHGFSVINQEGLPLDRPSPKNLGFGKPWSQLYGFSMVIDRQLATMNNLWRNSKDHFDARQPMAHDQWFNFIADLGGASVYLDEDLAAYRQHTSNACGFEVPRLAGDGLGKHLAAMFRHFLRQDALAFDEKRQTLQRLYRGKANSALARLTIARIIADNRKIYNVRQDRLALYAKAYQSFYLRSRLYSSLSRRLRLYLFVRLLCLGYVGMGRKAGVRDMILDLAYGVLARNHEGGLPRHQPC